LHEFVDVLDDPVPRLAATAGCFSVFAAQGGHDDLEDLDHHQPGLRQRVLRFAVFALPRCVGVAVVLVPRCPGDPPEGLLLGLPRSVQIRQAVVVGQLEALVERPEALKQVPRRGVLFCKRPDQFQPFVEFRREEASACEEERVGRPILGPEDQGSLRGLHLPVEVRVPVWLVEMVSCGLHQARLRPGFHRIRPGMEGLVVPLVVGVHVPLVVHILGQALIQSRKDRVQRLLEPVLLALAQDVPQVRRG
jgi:hypothetical protein